MTLLAQLLLAHLIGDFLLQPAAWVAAKEARKAGSAKLYYHVLIHFALLMVFVADLDFLPYAAIVAALHLGIDLLKLYAQRASTKRQWFFIDQGLHLLVLLALWWVYESPDLSHFQDSTTQVLWVAVFAILLSVPVAIFMQLLLSTFSPEPGKNSSLANAGKYIGILERLLILLFVLVGQWAGVGFLLAAKSIFRFGDLKEAQDRKLTEYIMIGTLLSFGIAMLCALLCQAVLRSL